jgi:hypothetical protein
MIKLVAIGDSLTQGFQTELKMESEQVVDYLV